MRRRPLDLFGRRPARRALVVLTVITIVPAATAGALTMTGDGASAGEAADRGSALQATDTVPPSTGCRRVIVIGDSLMDNSRPWLVDGLRHAGFEAVVDAQPSRRIPSAVRAPYSGVTAARSVRATFGEADCWVIALGSNDLPYGGLVAATIDGWFDEMLSVVTPGAHVWWVNLDYHRDPEFPFDFVRAATLFNAELTMRATADPLLDTIDWYSLAEAHQQWFFDPVHVDRTGSIARAEQTVAALPH